MVLESTFICLDNSEFMRNGDFHPTRLSAQQDAVNLVAQSKLRSNPESNVGIMTLSELNVLVTLTTDQGKLLAKLHTVQPMGTINFIQGIKIAHLALKHRQGKNHKTRIVAFVGSPLNDDEPNLVKMAKKLKKEKVNVDIISFGEYDVNADALKKFVETVNGKDGTGSHLVTIPPGPHLSDALISSPILQGEDGSGPNVIASGGGGFEFGVDPNEDPELALALRVSMEEQRARQQAETGEGGAEEPAGTPTSAPAGEVNSEEALLQRALAMSMETDEAAAGAAPAAPAADLGAMTEEEQIAYAMRMSMQEDAAAAAGEDKDSAMDVDDGKEDYTEAMNDPSFLQNVLENLPGVDPQSDAVKSAMDAVTGSAKDAAKKKEDKEKK
jgi:26S proteasome regulatory subunit N10